MGKRSPWTISFALPAVVLLIQKEFEREKYSGGCIFVDHATGHLHVELQVDSTTHEKTIKSKQKYEQFCRDLGVIPQEYHTDQLESQHTKHDRFLLSFNMQQSISFEIVIEVGSSVHVMVASQVLRPE
jgi:hypothetical protein